MSRKKTGTGDARRRAGRVGNDPDQPYVSVFCDGTVKGQPHEKWRIATFHPDRLNSELVWLPAGKHYFEPGVDHGIPIVNSVSQRLDGDTWVSNSDRDLDYYKPEFRVRWNIKCQECGASKVTAAPSTLYPAFTALAQLNIREIELAHLIYSERHAQ
ncbi:hypothetical protein [Microbacterium sp. K24]|uniref:hypothetical protein n=1 Tax=Microbacterium sp. K24 TaxID=2305446 RepID=UPI00109D6B6B|nr:hypothetical protein [Microbacterium sp. K24]